ncbi:SDR family NAD(P)-dependent oxidoreductase [Tomitella fengzijianii]|uniref:SDR family NAD(P)-dependent oxidoreductase n=2 Tax=Tomitella fengzijianii TaxID=2597660 RepID=A0A516WZL8_9ACTN|nr:SDR family NAD(P)-dependent oxidoreductase [Tomitella fengzijianii]QDQ96245.1 SDR family NAD(P)-dependent oxidoreductase [Tomitella fengzijianii]
MGDAQHQGSAEGAAVITGAGSGIGAAVARRAAARGMPVVLADLSAERIEAVATAITDAGGDALTVPTDVADPDSVEALAEAAYARHERVGLLVNNAGVESLGSLWELPVDEWRRVMSVNIDGAFHGIRSFVPRMGADPGPSRVVVTTSVGGIGTLAGMGAYGVSKHAVQQMTETLHLECAQAFPQIGVSAFVPAHVTTRIFEDVAPSAHAGAAVDHWRTQLRQKGMTADEAARIFFDGVDRGDFWICTHPDVYSRLAGRRAQLLAEALPPDYG